MCCFNSETLAGKQAVNHFKKFFDKFTMSGSESDRYNEYMSMNILYILQRFAYDKELMRNFIKQFELELKKGEL